MPAPKDVSPYNLEKLARFYNDSLDYLMGMTEQALHMICLQLGIDYEKVNAVDRMVLKRILKMSPVFQTVINQRGKKQEKPKTLF